MTGRNPFSKVRLFLPNKNIYMEHSLLTTEGKDIPSQDSPGYPWTAGVFFQGRLPLSNLADTPVLAVIFLLI